MVEVLRNLFLSTEKWEDVCSPYIEDFGLWHSGALSWIEESRLLVWRHRRGQGT